VQSGRDYGRAHHPLPGFVRGDVLLGCAGDGVRFERRTSRRFKFAGFSIERLNRLERRTSKSAADKSQCRDALHGESTYQDSHIETHHVELATLVNSESGSPTSV